MRSEELTESLASTPLSDLRITTSFAPRGVKSRKTG